MKLYVALLAAFAGTSSAKTLRNLKKDASAETKTYEADFGDYGTVTATLKSGDLELDFGLKAIKDDMFADESDPALSFGYHLHSAPVLNGFGAKVDGTNGNCGPTITLGHYDASLACGGASTAPLCTKGPFKDCCKTKGGDAYANACTTSTPEGCEYGDLSGRAGKLVVEKGGKISVTEEFECPTCKEDYLEDGDTANYATWKSLVLHDGDTGARVLCADFVEV